MKLFTKEIDKKLFEQYSKGSNLENQQAVVKIFNPYGRGTWYILNSDPEDPDYLWAIVDLFDVEMGSVSRSELESILVPPFRLNLERDTSFSPMNALELYNGLREGKMYKKGGNIKQIPVGEEYRYKGSSSIEKDVLAKIEQQLHGLRFAGNFGMKDWNQEAYLYFLDDFDRNLVANIPVNQNERIYRYFTRNTAIGGMLPLVKINLDNGLVYFNEEGDEGTVRFSKKGLKTSFINLVKASDKDYYQTGGTADSAMSNDPTIGGTMASSMARGGKILEIGDLVHITDNKSLFKGRSGVIMADLGGDYMVKILVEGEERNVLVKAKGLHKIQEMAEGGEVFKSDLVVKTNEHGDNYLYPQNPDMNTEGILMKDGGNVNARYIVYAVPAEGQEAEILGYKETARAAQLFIKKLEQSGKLNFDDYFKYGYDDTHDFFYSGKSGLFKNGGGVGEEFKAQDFDKLKKGDEIMITYESGISRSNNVSLQVKSKTTVGKGKSYQSEKITFINKGNPNGVKYYAYKRADGNVGFAVGDMGIWGVQQTNKMKRGGATAAQKKKVGKVMHEFKAKELHSGSNKGPIVKKREQAIAIALSEAGLSKPMPKKGWKHRGK